MDSRFGAYSDELEVDIVTCHECGHAGKIVWDDVSRMRHAQPCALGPGLPFLERISRTAPYPIELVCPSCGGVAVTAYPSTTLHHRGEYN